MSMMDGWVGLFTGRLSMVCSQEKTGVGNRASMTGSDWFEKDWICLRSPPRPLLPSLGNHVITVSSFTLHSKHNTVLERVSWWHPLSIASDLVSSLYRGSRACK
jgi:hypothetical protein